MFEGCPYLESLSIAFEGPEFDPHIFEATMVFIPTTVKVLHLCHVTEKCAKQLAHKCSVQRIAETSAPSGITCSVRVSCQAIQSLSLVVDHITDELLTSITQNLSLLIKLDLRDEPLEEQLLRHDLTNRGLQSLGSCNHLSHLSLVRSRVNSTFFRRVNDMGIFLMAEACRNMESIKLGGFIRVTDAGFSALIHTCKTLKTFELYNTFHLSDLAFLGLLDTSLSLVSVRLILCKLITSESVNHLALCENLELLDLNGCKSVADHGMRAISGLKKLNTLYLSGADITDTGLNYLGEGKLPLVSLSLRGCKRVTDKGIAFLLGGSIKKTLKALDLGYIPGISDKAITTLTEFGLEIVDLCIRNCYSVTDISIAVLANTIHDGLDRKALKRLDLYKCIGLSAVSLHWLSKPYFPHLRWLGLGPASLFPVHGSKKLGEITGHTNLIICQEGCEIGCRDRWQFHDYL